MTHLAVIFVIFATDTAMHCQISYDGYLWEWLLATILRMGGKRIIAALKPLPQLNSPGLFINTYFTLQ